jgi:hypothetical protein
VKRNKKRLIAAVGVICALAAGGAAYTTAIAGFPSNNAATIAFGGTQIQGAPAAGVSYTLSSDGQYITAADIYFTGSEQGYNVDAGFGTTATNAQLISCTPDSGTAVGGSGTYAADYDTHCTFLGTSTFPSGVQVTQANYFSASVTKNTAGAITGVTVNP